MGDRPRRARCGSRGGQGQGDRRALGCRPPLERADRRRWEPPPAVGLTAAAEAAAGADRKLIVNFDGGARGNPGPAAVAAVISTPGGEVLEERGEGIGVATNNVAEYRALLLAIERARALGAAEAELIGD